MASHLVHDNRKTTVLLAPEGFDPSPALLPVGSLAHASAFGSLVEQNGRKAYRIHDPYTGRQISTQLAVLGLKAPRGPVVDEAIKAAGIDPDLIFFEIVNPGQLTPYRPEADPQVPAAADDAETLAIRQEDEVVAEVKVYEWRPAEYWVAAFGYGNGDEVRGVADAIFTRVL